MTARKTGPSRNCPADGSSVEHAWAPEAIRFDSWSRAAVGRGDKPHRPPVVVAFAGQPRSGCKSVKPALRHENHQTALILELVPRAASSN